MVILHVKKGDESQFLFNAPVIKGVQEILADITLIFNGRLKISRICYEMEELAEHGTQLPDDMMGLTEEQVTELKLKDEWGEQCIPSGGFTFSKDEIGRRNGKQPSERMQQVLKKAIEDAKTIVSKKQVESGVMLTVKHIHEALDLLRGAVMIVYPMGLPPHDNVKRELDNNEDLEGMQASKEVIDPSLAQLWFSGKELERHKKLSDYLGNNDKTKIIVKLTKKGQGAPGREPAFSEEERKKMMAHAYRRQEELKKLDQNDDDEYHNSTWADSGRLKRQFQGLGSISWRPK